jgi:hypothetical protein
MRTDAVGWLAAAASLILILVVHRWVPLNAARATSFNFPGSRSPDRTASMSGQRSRRNLCWADPGRAALCGRRRMPRSPNAVTMERRATTIKSSPIVRGRQPKAGPLRHQPGSTDENGPAERVAKRGRRRRVEEARYRRPIRYGPSE